MWLGLCADFTSYIFSPLNFLFRVESMVFIMHQLTSITVNGRFLVEKKLKSVAAGCQMAVSVFSYLFILYLFCINSWSLSSPFRKIHTSLSLSLVDLVTLIKPWLTIIWPHYSVTADHECTLHCFLLPNQSKCCYCWGQIYCSRGSHARFLATLSLWEMSLLCWQAERLNDNQSYY